ncbi:MAG: hypothetical protein ACERKN_05900 [Velocimicrobium sp.]
MPIRPIDMLSMPSRSQEASQVHQAENQKLTHAQEQLGVQYNTNVKHDGKQAVKMSKSENPEYRYSDGKGNDAREFGQQRGKKKKKEAEKGKKIKSSNFDIRI